MEHTPLPYESAPPPGPERRRKVIGLEWLQKWRKSGENQPETGAEIPPETERPKKLARKVLEALGIRKQDKRQESDSSTGLEEERPVDIEPKSFVARLRERGRSLLRLAERVEYAVVESAPPEAKAAAAAEVAPVAAAAEKLGEALDDLDEVVVAGSDVGGTNKVEWGPEAVAAPSGEDFYRGSPDIFTPPASSVDKTRKTSVAPVAAAAAVVASGAGLSFAHARLENRYYDLKQQQKNTQRKLRTQEKRIAAQERTIDKLEEQQVNYANHQERRSYIEKVAEATSKQAEVTHEVVSDIRAQKQAEHISRPDVFHIPVPTAERAPAQPEKPLEAELPTQKGQEFEIPLQRRSENLGQTEKQVDSAEPIIAPEIDDGRIERNIYTHDQQAADNGVRMGGAAVRTTLDEPQATHHHAAMSTNKDGKSTQVSAQVRWSPGQRWLYAAVITTAAIAIIGAILAAT